jgi:hypothetical protein
MRCSMMYHWKSTGNAYEGQQPTYKSGCGTRPKSKHQPGKESLQFEGTGLPISECSPNIPPRKCLLFTSKRVVVLYGIRQEHQSSNWSLYGARRKISKTRTKAYCSSRPPTHALLGLGTSRYPENRPILGNGHVNQ